MIEDVRNAVDWDSLRTEVFCPVKHGGESVEHYAKFYLRAKCPHCDYVSVSPRCQRSVEVVARAIAKGLPVSCPHCSERTRASMFYKVVGEVNK